MDMYGVDDRGNEDKEDDDGRKMVVMMIMIMFENQCGDSTPQEDADAIESTYMKVGKKTPPN